MAAATPPRGKRPGRIVRTSQRDSVVYALRNPQNIVVVDGCPVPRGIAWALRYARKQGWTGTINSCDRREGVAEKCGKSSQAALYRAWQKRQRGVPGYTWANPANAPGFSTHEYFGDGTAYGVDARTPLAWWCVGLDVTDAAGLVRALDRAGFEAARFYSSPSEAHHVNLTANPWPVVRAKQVRKAGRS